jgi:hypothetical protein
MKDKLFFIQIIVVCTGIFFWAVAYLKTKNYILLFLLALFFLLLFLSIRFRKIIDWSNLFKDPGTYYR